MTDKELLELAAKAAGIEIQGKVEKMIAECGHYAGGFVITNSRGGSSSWNPLTDDGDALRLAVKLGMLVDVRYREGESKLISVTYWIKPERGERIEIIGESYASTRRAIVRAAAEIGKAMPCPTPQ